MSEYEEQKKDKPDIDELIERLLRGRQREAAVDFVTFLRSNKMSPRWGAINSYNLGYKGRRVCIIKIAENHFELRINTQYNEQFNSCFSEESEQIRQYLRDSVTYCFGCGECKPGVTMELLGVTVENACMNPVIKMENPDDEKLAPARRLVLLRREMIAEGKAPRVTYISVKKRR